MALRTLERGADDYIPKTADQRHLDALPFTIEKTLHRKHIRERERELTRQLLESEQRFHLLVQSVRDYAIYMLDREGHVTTWNIGVERIKGWKAEEIIGRHFSAFFTPEDAAAGKPQHELELAARDGSFQEQGQRVRKDGSTFWADVTVTAIRDQQGDLVGFAKVTRDISDSIRAEQALRASQAHLQQANEQLQRLQHELEERVQERTAELARTNDQLRLQIAEREKVEQELRVSEERFRLLVEGVKDYAIYGLDPSGHITSWNAGAQRIKGYRAEEIIGQHYSCFFAEEDIRAGKPEAELATAAAEGKFAEEAWRVRKDKTRFWASISVTAVRSPSGQLIGFSKVTRDMTERRRMEEALRDANDNLQSFTYTAAHDLRSPLRTINGFASILRNDYPAQLGPDCLAALDRIATAATRMQQLLNDLLEYSKITQAQIRLGPVNLQSAVSEALALLESDIRARNVEVSVQENLPLVQGHAATVVLLINNLVSNALKFVPPDRQPHISIGAQIRNDDPSTEPRAHLAQRQEATAQHAPDHQSAEPQIPASNHLVRLWVQDNGIGIAQEHLLQVFGLFTRLQSKEAYPGTGLGLAIVKKGVERMGGRVGVESQPGQGSRFWLELMQAHPC